MESVAEEASVNLNSTAGRHRRTAPPGTPTPCAFTGGFHASARGVGPDEGHLGAGSYSLDEMGAAGEPGTPVWPPRRRRYQGEDAFGLCHDTAEIG